MSAITARTLMAVRPALSAYFIRDNSFKGFAIRVFPSGTIKYIVEVWAHGRSHRGEYTDENFSSTCILANLIRSSTSVGRIHSSGGELEITLE